MPSTCPLANGTLWREPAVEGHERPVWTAHSGAVKRGRTYALAATEGLRTSPKRRTWRRWPSGSSARLRNRPRRRSLWATPSLRDRRRRGGDGGPLEADGGDHCRDGERRPHLLPARRASSPQEAPARKRHEPIGEHFPTPGDDNRPGAPHRRRNADRGRADRRPRTVQFSAGAA
jgi:hypothetical protein